MVRDRGSASHRYLRTSINVVPPTSDQFRKLRIPWVVLARPLAPAAPGDEPVPLASFPGASGPPRCAACRAYVNPGFQVSVKNDGRVRMTCNLCGSEFDGPDSYVPHVVPSAQRHLLGLSGAGGSGGGGLGAANQASAGPPELSKGSYEAEVSGEYLVRPPEPPCHLFLIETSRAAIETGAARAAARAVRAALDALPAPERALVALATFDSGVAFYDLAGAQSRRTRSANASASASAGAEGGSQGPASALSVGGAHAATPSGTLDASSPSRAPSAFARPPPALVVGDVSDPFCPLPPPAARPLRHVRPALLAALDAVERLEPATAPLADGAAGAAIAAAVDALAAPLEGTPLAALAAAQRARHRGAHRYSGLVGMLEDPDARNASASAADAQASSSLPLPLAPFGGLVHAFVSTLPRRGAPASRAREVARPALGDSDRLDGLLPADASWTDLAARAADGMVRVDVHALPSAPHVDLASLAALAGRSGGRLFAHCAEQHGGGGGGGGGTFVESLHARSLLDAVARRARGAVGLEAVARLRCSDGVRLCAVRGACRRRGAGDDLHFPVLDAEETVCLELEVSDAVKEVRGEIALQYAVLYSTPGGSRRVRVHTLRLPAARGAGSAYRGADADAVALALARRAADRAPGATLGDARAVARGGAIDLLAAYRRFAAQQSDPNQLLLPESLQLLPLYALGIEKSPLLRAQAPLDARAAWAARALAEGAEDVQATLYPRLIAIDDVIDPIQGLKPHARTSDANDLSADQTNPADQTTASSPYASLPAGLRPLALLPARLPLTAAALDPAKVHLLEDGREAVLRVGPAADPALVRALLGVDAPPPERDPAPPRALPRLDTPASNALWIVLSEIERQRRRALPTRVLARSQGDEDAFAARLVEDRTSGDGQSYQETLRAVHKEIVKRLRG